MLNTLEITASSFTDTKPSRSRQISFYYYCFSFAKLYQSRVETSVKLATKVSCSSTFAKFSFLSEIGDKPEISQSNWTLLLFEAFQTSLGMSGNEQNGEGAGQSSGPCLWLSLFCNHHLICSHVKTYFFMYLLSPV